jgi:hypothetical protein
MNTSQNRASVGKGFHHRALRRVVPEPWLSSQGGVHSQMKSLVLVMAYGTPPLKRKDFELEFASWWKKTKEDIFVFIKIKDTDMRTN